MAAAVTRHRQALAGRAFVLATSRRNAYGSFGRFDESGIEPVGTGASSAVGPPPSGRSVAMAKGQMKSNREVRKPKKEKAPAPAAVSPFGKAGPAASTPPKKKG